MKNMKKFGLLSDLMNKNFHIFQTLVLSPHLWRLIIVDILVDLPIRISFLLYYFNRNETKLKIFHPFMLLTLKA